MIHIKSAYEPFHKSDGHRVLIDRLWPRGVSRARAHLDEWAKDIAPSAELRQWYQHDPSKWPEFRKRYLRELRSASARAVLDALVRRARRGPVTLVYSSSTPSISDVAVLEKKLSRRLRRLRSR